MYRSAALTRAWRRGWRCSSTAAQALELPTTEARDLMSERLQAAITPDVCQSLSSMGWAVVDGAFGPRLCSALRSELVGISDRMQTNCTHLVVDANNNRKLLPKHNIWEAELRDKVILYFLGSGSCCWVAWRTRERSAVAALLFETSNRAHSFVHMMRVDHYGPLSSQTGYRRRRATVCRAAIGPQHASHA